MARKPRGISADDRDLWQRAMRGVDPLRDVPLLDPDLAATPAKPMPLPRSIGGPRIKPFAIGATARPEPAPQKPSDRFDPKMDKRQFDRFRKGKLAIDGRVDLHGMTADVAHRALIAFVQQSDAAGHRVLLVITGKGRTARETDGISPASGVLRRAVPMWLRQAPLSSVVLQVVSASRQHGGDGALYVYLRRRR
jgi:DNA-nicking Smr family endonuclease